MGARWLGCWVGIERFTLCQIGCPGLALIGCCLQIELEGALKIVASVQSSASFTWQGLPWFVGVGSWFG